MIELEPLLTAIFAGILYSLIWWAAKNVDPTKPSPSFDWVSLLSTAVIGVCVGMFMTLSGNPVTQMSIEAQLAANGAIIAVVREILLTGFRWFASKFPEGFSAGEE